MVGGVCVAADAAWSTGEGLQQGGHVPLLVGEQDRMPTASPTRLPNTPGTRRN